MDKTMKDETPNAFDKMLMLFVSKNFLRPELQLPMKYGEYIYATNNYTIARIKSDMTNVRYTPLTEQEHKKLPVENSFKNITPNCNFRISIVMLEDAIACIPQRDEEVEVEHDKKCDECNGTGEVEWQYETYTKYFNCPVCYGTGFSEEKRRVKTGKKIPEPETGIRFGNVVLSTYSICNIAEAMKQIGATHIRYDFQSTSINHFIIDDYGIEIALLPILYFKKYCTINLTGKNQM